MWMSVSYRSQLTFVHLVQTNTNRSGPAGYMTQGKDTLCFVSAYAQTLNRSSLVRLMNGSMRAIQDFEGIVAHFAFIFWAVLNGCWSWFRVERTRERHRSFPRTLGIRVKTHFFSPKCRTIYYTNLLRLIKTGLLLFVASPFCTCVCKAVHNAFRLVSMVVSDGSQLCLSLLGLSVARGITR